tara:strand:- start:40 stop:264 length:225 start_codon:yes stop_codon:yes gene_type:complete
MQKYEVGVYNKFIRDKVREGERVKVEEAKWEEVHYFDIESENEIGAVKIIREKYSKLLGFEIECITKYTTSSYD